MDCLFIPLENQNENMLSNYLVYPRKTKPIIKNTMPVCKVSPSMLSSDFANLAVEAKRMWKNGAEWLHLGKS
jgi:hypothetical protein